MTWISGLVVILCGLFMDLNISAALCNFGTFTSFVIICLAVLILRETEPNRHRPFKVPFCPWFPIAGISICGVLIIFLIKDFKNFFNIFLIMACGWCVDLRIVWLSSKRIEERGRIIKNT